MKTLYKHYKSNILKMLLLSGLLSFLRVLPSYLLAFATNAIFARNISQFLFWDLVILILWLIYVCSNYLFSVYQEKELQKISLSLRKREADSIKTVPLADFNKITADGYVSKLTNDITQIETQGVMSLYRLFSNGWLILFSIVALALFNLWLVVLVLGLTGLILYIPNKFGTVLVALGQKLSTSNSSYTKRIANILKGYNVFRYNNRLAEIPKKITEYSQDLSENKVAIAKTNHKIMNLIAFSSLLSQVVVDIVTGFLAIIGQTTIGAISSSGNLAANIFNSVSLVGQSAMELRSIEPVIETFFVDKPIVRATKKTYNEFTDCIRIENLSFGYDANLPILENFNLDIKKGGKYLLTGDSGSGKSTLLKILIGDLEGYSGEIKVDGHQLIDVDSHSFIQYIDQDNYLFNTSYKENVALWNNYASTEIAEALNKAAADFVDDIDKVVENNGTNLSGGQKQRIGLARAFIQKKSVILFDEGTSSLDKKNTLLIENLLLEDNELTVVMVSHHPLEENIHKFDQIISISAPLASENQLIAMANASGS
ncbi:MULTISPECIES: ATP-binding cassette domain-containing protein [Enterococcus]|uniref:ATP-binding cassette domain-containing protein n=1 Tax=Enterococcus TaxID=1350 RepID=UPI0010FF8523|nr:MULTISPECIES: ABC transporter ATP-binding protein [Enterococcus]MBO6418802.1 ABC transporter ATP-binding protein [Enterococcus gallinarum]MBO6420653.1 ABC transporter ATP-binding protein [Enterococcus gallinarum]MBW5472528.1 ATP-binding cassette domain-containing protein [Enterococcus gallinarum]MDQ6110000.1 ABC transporter ATP-binding protein/permease [Enterococcus gallinarum]MUN91254.1 ATP-binding cassette domain-containing protein [Enterococcus gallinarum]